jgi:hypothetical protein
MHGDGDKQQYLDEVLDKFVDEYLMTTQDNPESDEKLDDLDDHVDRVREYSLCLRKLFFILPKCYRSSEIGGW